MAELGIRVDQATAHRWVSRFSLLLQVWHTGKLSSRQPEPFLVAAPMPDRVQNGVPGSC
jgi:hypothetical protein